jgi:putative transposase
MRKGSSYPPSPRAWRESSLSARSEHLRAAVREFVDHYHEERPHQGLGNELIAPQAEVIGTGPLKCRQRLGGVLKFYHREAA